MVETFFIECLKPTTDLETFDDLHLAAFTTACTSTNARKHIHRAYYQLQLSVQTPLDSTLTMNAEAYGFERRDNLLVLEIVNDL